MAASQGSRGSADVRRPAAVRVSARLPLGVRARGRAAGRRASGQGQGLAAQPVHRGRDLRQGRALRRALSPPRPAGAAAAPDRPEGLGRVRAGRLGRCAGRGGRSVRAQGAAARLGDRLAVFLRGHHGPGAARRHQPPAPRHALFGLAHHDLRDPVRHRLARRLRPALGRDRRGDGALGPDRDLGHQPGEHPGQRHDPRGAGEKGARRPPGRGRPVSHGHGGAGGRASGAAARAPTARSPAR